MLPNFALADQQKNHSTHSSDAYHYDALIRPLTAGLPGRTILSVLDCRETPSPKRYPGRAFFLPNTPKRLRVPMKRTYFVCLFLCLTTTFLLAQLQLPLSGPQAAQGVSRPRFKLQRALPVPHFGPLGPSGKFRRLPFSPWEGAAAGSSQQNFGNRVMAKPKSAMNSIFLAAPTYGSGGVDALSVAVADVNGDGKRDLLVANICASNSNCEHGGVSVSLGNGDGTFQVAVTYDSGGSLAFSVAVGDVNGDGRPDMLVANECASSNNCDGGVGVLLGNGDGTFQAAVTYSSGGYDADSVAVGDVNGDGKPDLLVANNCTDNSCLNGASVGVLLGNGDGTFQAAMTYGSGGYQAFSVAVGDVNGDGKPDLLVANLCDGRCDNGTVGVLLGNGNGTFQAAVSYGSGGFDAGSVAVGDVNGDGKPDLLVANECGTDSSCINGGVGVLLGNGDGTFQAAASHGSGGYQAFSVAVGDVNGDGNSDLLVANNCADNSCLNGASVGVLLGNGDGTFQAAVTYGSGGFFARSLVVGDVNGDGKPDVLVVNYCASSSNCGQGSGNVGVLLGNGDGTFRAAMTYGSGGYNAFSVAVADVNGDGKPDLLVANNCTAINCTDSGSIGVLLGNGDGTFQAAVTYGSGGYHASSVAVGDVNGDGKPDLLVANNCTDNSCLNGASVGVLLGNGDGTFQAVMTYDSGGILASSVVAADVNGDGKPDVLVVNYCASSSNCGNDTGPGNVGVLLGNGDGTFQAAMPYGSGGYNAFSVAVADVNEDGKPDVLVANVCTTNLPFGACGGGGVSVLLGNGDGTFQAAVTYGPGGTYTYSVAVGDVNGDGKPDLVVVNYCASDNCASGGVGVLLGNGDGTLQPAASIAIPGNNSGPIALADFNGDGKLDVAAGSYDALLLGNGDGTFQAPLTLGASGQGIAVGDFNRDGRPDLAVGGVSVLLNISSGFIFPTTTTITSSSNPSAFGQSVTFTAPVASQGSGTPTGKVTFRNGSTVLATRKLKSGSAKYTTAKLHPGSNIITAVYSGDSNNAGSTSTALNQLVLAATTTTLTSSQMHQSMDKR